MIQLDIPIGKIAKKLSRITDEMILYGKSGGRLFLIAMDPAQTMAIQIDAGISLDEDFTAGLFVKELGETSKGVKYLLDYDQGVWRITYETASGLKVRKKIAGLEPSVSSLEVIMNVDAKLANGEAIASHDAVAQALSEVEEGVALVRFVKGKPSKMLVIVNEPGKEVEVEVPVEDVVREFEAKINLSLLKEAIEVLKLLSENFRIGLTEQGIFVVEPSFSTGETRVIIAPVVE